MTTTNVRPDGLEDLSTPGDAPTECGGNPPPPPPAVWWGYLDGYRHGVLDGLVAAGAVLALLAPVAARRRQRRR